MGFWPYFDTLKIYTIDTDKKGKHSEGYYEGFRIVEEIPPVKSYTFKIKKSEEKKVEEK